MATMTQPIGYTFHTDQLHPQCLVERLLASGELSPAARDMSTEQVLWQYTEANALEQGDEDYPEAMFYSPDLSDERCDHCGELFLED